MNKLGIIIVASIAMGGCDESPVSNVSTAAQGNVRALANVWKDRHGVSETYFDNGQLAERGTLVFGKRHGVWRAWYPDGTPFSETAYLDGVPMGRWRFFHRDGSPMARYDFAAGCLTGDEIVWDRTGEVASFVSHDRPLVQ